MDRVFDAAMAHGVALEINGQTDRLDLDDVLARVRAIAASELIIDSTRTHRLRSATCAGGAASARRAWLEPHDVLNTQPIGAFRGSARHRR